MKRIPLIGMLMALLLLAVVVFTQNSPRPIESTNANGGEISVTQPSGSSTLEALLGIDQSDPVGAAHFFVPGPPPVASAFIP